MEEDQISVNKIKIDLMGSVDTSSSRKCKMEPLKESCQSVYDDISKQETILSSNLSSLSTSLDRNIMVKQENIDNDGQKWGPEQELSLPDNHSSFNSSMDENIRIKREKIENYELLSDGQEWESTSGPEQIKSKRRKLSNPDSVVLKRKNTRAALREQVDEHTDWSSASFTNCQDQTSSSIEAEDTYDDSCDSNETLPEHLSDFATPLMEMEVLETDETNSARSKNGTRRKRNRAKFVRSKASRGMAKGCENCRSKCHLRITEDQRLSIFEYFWNLEDASSQWQFIDMHTRTKETERKTTNWQSNRKISRTYFFDLGGNEVKVCQVMFLSTLGVSEKWVRNLVQTLKGDQGVISGGRNDMEGISALDGSFATSQNDQGEIAPSILSEEEISSGLAERTLEESDSSDSHQTLPEFPTPLLDTEVVETPNTSTTPEEVEEPNTSSTPRKSKPRSESKWRRGKVMGKGCENCRAKCHLKITEAQRSAMFEHFWSLGDSSQQWRFLASHTKTKETERKTTNWHSNRKVSRSYYFDVGKEQVKVCQVMFLTTLGVSEKWIKTALSKKDQDLFPDRRGKTRKPFCKLRGPVLESIIQHINLFERCQECREIWDKVCLPESLSLRKMYEFYGEFMKEKQKRVDEEAKPNQQKVVLTVATERQYRDVFKKEFSLPFHPPRKGQCERCVLWKPDAADVTNEVREEMEEHIRQKDAVRGIKDADKVEAVKQLSICLASFESQRIGLPCGEVPDFYYADRLNVYNFSVFDIGRSQAYCYVWHQQTAKRGSNECGSCLKDFVEQRITCGVNDFRFYSDSCALLKKNKNIFGLWYVLAIKHAVHISHRFLESGHTLTEGHAVLYDIERKTRKQSLFNLQEVMTMIRDIKDNKPFIVKEVEQECVYDLEDSLSGQNWVKDSNGNEVRWRDVREVMVSGDSPGIMKFRYNFLSEYLILQVEAPENEGSVSDYEFKRAYNQKIPLMEAKKNGLISLCTKNLVPADRQDFYHQLTTKCEENEEE